MKWQAKMAAAVSVLLEEIDRDSKQGQKTKKR
jgi:hypothetical protein